MSKEFKYDYTSYIAGPASPMALVRKALADWREDLLTDLQLDDVLAHASRETVEHPYAAPSLDGMVRIRVDAEAWVLAPAGVTAHPTETGAIVLPDGEKIKFWVSAESCDDDQGEYLDLNHENLVARGLHLEPVQTVVTVEGTGPLGWMTRLDKSQVEALAADVQMYKEEQVSDLAFLELCKRNGLLESEAQAMLASLDDGPCSQGIHSWADHKGLLPPDTKCQHCPELYGRPD